VKSKNYGCLVSVTLIVFFGGLWVPAEPLKLAAIAFLGFVGFYAYLRGPFGLRPNPNLSNDVTPGLAGAWKRLFHALRAPVALELGSAGEFRPESRYVYVWTIIALWLGASTAILDSSPLYFGLAWGALLVCRLALAERRIEDLRAVLANHIQETKHPRRSLQIPR